MKKVFTFLVIGLLCTAGIAWAVQSEEPTPTEKQLRFVDHTDPSGATHTVEEKDYQGDLKLLPKGTKKRIDMRVDAKTGQVSKRKVLIVPVD